MASMSYAEKARLSNYELIDGVTLVVRNAWLLWRNFAGDPNKNFGHQGFTLLLDEPIAEQMLDAGWNVKKRIPQNEEDDPFYVTEISVKTDCKYPPVFILYTEFDGQPGEREMDLDEIWMLDEKIRIKKADLVVKLASKGGRYLQELRVTERQQKSWLDRFGESRPIMDED